MRLLPVRLRGERLRAVWQKFAKEFAKFGTVGVINTGINYGVFNLLLVTVLPQGQLKANVLATVVATTASYFMNRYWTYKDRPKTKLRREYTLFFLLNLAGLVIEVGVLAAAKYGLALSGLLAINIAKTVGVILGTLFRFWTYRTFVFPKGLAAGEVRTTAPGDPPAGRPIIPAQLRRRSQIRTPVDHEVVNRTATRPQPLRQPLRFGASGRRVANQGSLQLTTS